MIIIIKKSTFERCKNFFFLLKNHSKMCELKSEQKKKEVRNVWFFLKSF